MYLYLSRENVWSVWSVFGCKVGILVQNTEGEQDERNIF